MLRKHLIEKYEPNQIAQKEGELRKIYFGKAFGHRHPNDWQQENDGRWNGYKVYDGKWSYGWRINDGDHLNDERCNQWQRW